MDSLKIECFNAVAKTQSFSKASTMLFKNQSVISRQILALENELGVRLLNRGTRSVTLTKAGEIFSAGLSKIEGIYASMIDDIHAAQSGYIGEVKICTHPGTIFIDTLSPVVLAFEEQHPEIFVDLQTAYSGDVIKSLNNQSIDLTFWRWEEYSDTNRNYICIAKRQNGLLLCTDHPKASVASENLTLDDFVDDTIILLPETVAPKLGNRLVRKFVELGHDPKVLYAPNLDTSILWMTAKRGIIATSEHCICAGNPAFRFVALEQLGTTDFSFIWDKRNNNPSLEVFVRFLSSYIKNG